MDERWQATSHRNRRPGRAVRVIVVDNQRLFAELLTLALRMEGYDATQIEVPQGRGNPAELVSRILRGRPHIVLLGLDLRSGNGARLIEPIARSGAAVTVITESSEGGLWGECVVLGARKVISKNSPLRDVVVAIRRLSQGDPAMKREERERLTVLWSEEQASQTAYQDRLDRLTTREAEILGHLTHGRTVREIATRSVVAESTVRTQVKSILAKLGVSSQLHAVGLAHTSGWRSPVA